MRGLFTLVLALALPLAVHADDTPAQPQQPIAPPAIPAESLETPKRKRNAPKCEGLLTWIKSASPSSEQTEEFKAEVRKLEEQDAALLKAENALARRTYIVGNQLFMNLITALDRGEEREALPLVQKYVQDASNQTKKVIELAKEIHEYGKKNAQKNPEGLAWLKMRYIEESKVLGQKYGYYKMIMDTLMSVADGAGLKNVNTLKQDVSGKPTNEKALAQVDSELAKKTAKAVLERLNSDSGLAYLPNAPKDETPAADEIPYVNLDIVRQVFHNNIYCLIGRLEWGIAEQNLASQPWRKALHFLAEGYLAVTDKLPIPESFRKFALTATGIAYDDLMLYRYLGAIASVVEVTQYIDSKGNLVINSDPDRVDNAIRALMEKDALATGEDFLVTFARIAYHTDTWTMLVNRVAEKAGIKNASAKPAVKKHDITKSDDDDDDDSTSSKPDQNGSQKWANLLKRMQTAEKRADKLGALPYVFPPTVSLHVRFAIFQLAEGIVAYEAVHGFSFETLKALVHLVW